MAFGAKGHDTRGDPDGRFRRGPGTLARIVAYLAGAGLTLAALGLAGFFWFAAIVVSGYPVSNETADGIVVLTGGRDRIQLAVEILEQKRARRLLISGVHPATTAVDIQRATETNPGLFACCVDLGHQAETTIGNALEADIWARANRFESLIVVTSAYHMPRALAELERSLPEVRLVPQPVRRPELGPDEWFRDARTIKLLLAEYLKYILARVRLGLETLGRD